MKPAPARGAQEPLDRGPELLDRGQGPLESCRRPRELQRIPARSQTRQRGGSKGVAYCK